MWKKNQIQGWCFLEPTNVKDCQQTTTSLRGKEHILPAVPQKEPSLLTLWSQTFSTQTYQMINLYGLSHWGCGTLLRQPGKPMHVPLYVVRPRDPPTQLCPSVNRAWTEESSDSIKNKIVRRTQSGQFQNSPRLVAFSQVPYFSSRDVVTLDRHRP